ncbi:MAG: iron ABC transporter permease [Lachnospiraceae bacterium]|nr:iron ABC transporter permease [Lachnospiraceae bacterium]
MQSILHKFRRQSVKFNIIILSAVLLAVIIFSVSVGSAKLSFAESLKLAAAKLPFAGRFVDSAYLGTKYETIVWKVRMPRTLTAALVGASLSLVGAAFQGIFRNPLADPHILGVSSGAAFGATLAMLTGAGAGFMGLGTVGIFAFAGALAVVFLVYSISKISGEISATSMLLTGTAISTFLSALISLLMTFHNDQIEKVYMWTMGSFSSAAWGKVGFLTLFAAIGAGILLMYARKLNLILMGDDDAKCLGIDVDRTRRHIIAAASILVGASVAVSGVIGFAGLMIPHCIRLVAGADNKKLMPYSFLLGAIFMTLCDVAARTVAAPTEIPVGIITAMFGAPYFIFLVLRRRKGIVLQP